MDGYTATEQAYKNGYEDGYESRATEINLTPCYMCDNARISDDLTDDNDLSACVVGTYDKDCSIMLVSGDAKPLRIEVRRWNDNAKHWENIGIYYPKYCPNCGREIIEYKK